MKSSFDSAMVCLKPEISEAESWRCSGEEVSSVRIS
jgi:hypothetical protein